MYFLKRLIVIVLLQLLIFSFIFTLFVFSFNQRREVSKNQSKALASVIAEQASNYFEENNNNFSSKDFFNFLDDQIGVQKLTNAFNVNPPELLTVYFRSDIMKGIVNAGTDDNLNKDDDSPFNKTNKFFFNNKYVAIKPFFIGTSDMPYGVVRIETSNIPILTEVLYNNGLLDINIDNNSRFDRNDDMVYGYNYATALSLDELESNIKGLKFEILNDSQNDFINPQVIIGGIDFTGQFIEVDNYSLSTIEKYSFENLLYSGSGQNRWEPDFERIKTIGTGKAYFKFKYDNNPASFINYEHHDWPNIYNHIMYIDLKDFEVIGCYGLLKIIIDNTNKIHVRNCAMYESVRDTN